MVEVTEKWGGVEEAVLYTFSSDSGRLQAKVTNYGATLASLKVKDAKGDMREVTVGYDTIQQWQAGGNYFGCTVGRYGNRIKEGKFSLDGTAYTLHHTNNGNNHLHGGDKGYDKRFWKGEVVETPASRGVKLTLVSPDGDNGYPGELHITAWVMLNTDDELLLKWRANVDGKKTIVNLTNHTYWNLGGWVESAPRDILDHKLTAKADRYVEVDDEAIPTGKLPATESSPFDFAAPHAIGERVDADLMKPVKGYDHTLVFASPHDPAAAQPEPADKDWSASLPHQVTLECEATGLGYKLFTSEPGVQLYTGNYLDASTEKGFGGKTVAHRGALCLECQHFPDAPNQPGFPSTTLSPGEVYNHTTVHKFTVQ